MREHHLWTYSGTRAGNTRIFHAPARYKQAGKTSNLDKSLCVASVLPRLLTYKYRMERSDHFESRMKIIPRRTRTHTAATIAHVQSPSALLAFLLSFLLLAAAPSHAEQPQKPTANPAAAAGQIADFFSKVGDEIYEDCIFELSPEQIEVQQALIRAYVAKGASSIVARRLAVQQIHPPKLSDRCEQIRRLPKTIPPDALSPPPSTKIRKSRQRPKFPFSNPRRESTLRARRFCPSGTVRRASTT